MPSAIVTGAAGQDGYYLTKLLLDKGYDVHAMVRKTSVPSTRLDDYVRHFPARFHLHRGDLLDSGFIHRVLLRACPSEVYNLAAMSDVAVSFDVPDYALQVNALGAARLLEAMRSVCYRASGSARFYQASTSELYGDSSVAQDEDTPFHPCSPYAASKLAAFWMTRIYRDAYGMHASNGILFNHECVSEREPLLVRRNGVVDVVTAAELVPLIKHGRRVQTFDIQNVEVWCGLSWTPLQAITATKHRPDDADHQMLFTEARGGIVETTSHHTMIRNDGQECPASELKEGDDVHIGRFPTIEPLSAITVELAEFLGLMVSEGYASPEGRLQFTNNDEGLRARVATLWTQCALGTSRLSFSPSGFNPERQVGQLYLHGNRAAGRWVREQIYTRDGLKKIPTLVLNAAPEIRAAFIKVYYAGDGLKAGNGESVKTNSPVLAQGLCWLYADMGRQCSVYIEHRGERTYYQLNIFTALPVGDKGAHLKRPPEQVRRITKSGVESEWVFDLATERQRFMCGVGRVVVHNSPMRADCFVSRKIAQYVAAWFSVGGGIPPLRLGNLDACRDWSHASDFVRGMWMIVQHDKPSDYVLASGATRSVREFVEQAFEIVGLTIKWRNPANANRGYIGDQLVVVAGDPEFVRPLDVPRLQGDATKAAKVLGWKPIVSFRGLVAEMVEAELAKLN